MCKPQTQKGSALRKTKIQKFFNSSDGLALFPIWSSGHSGYLFFKWGGGHREDEVIKKIVYNILLIRTANL